MALSHLSSPVSALPFASAYMFAGPTLTQPNTTGSSNRIIHQALFCIVLYCILPAVPSRMPRRATGPALRGRWVGDFRRKHVDSRCAWGLTWALRDVAQAAREYRVTIFGRGRPGQRPSDGGCGFLAFCFGEDTGFSAEKPQQQTAASHNSGVGPQTSSDAAGKDVRRRDGVKDGRSFVADLGAVRRQLGIGVRG